MLLNKQVKWGALLLTLAIWLTGQTAVTAAPLTSQTTRLSGTTRIETAIKVSQAGWQSGKTDTVLLARADDFPDSLVAIPLSYQLDAPILLTYPTSLDPQVAAEIGRLGASKVILLGGEGALGKSVTNGLDAAHLTWERIGGVDRYQTAALMAERLGNSTGQVILASGESFPDAMAVGPYAGVTQTPILLTSVKAMPDVTRSMLNKFQANAESPQTLVIGGEGVIPSSTLKDLQSIKRIAGKDRYETASNVYWFAQNQLPGNPEDGSALNRAYLVTGEDFPDALAAGALAAKQAAPMFLSLRTDLPAITYSAMGNVAQNNLEVYLIGGVGALNDKVKGIVEGTIQPPYLLGGLTIVVDPGHGGPDPGATGYSLATSEKNNTLAIGLYLTDLLRAAGAKVVLTRSTDVSPAGSKYTKGDIKPDLQARVDIANNAKADLFVSIHNNSSSDPLAHGLETYYSSQAGDDPTKVNPAAMQSQRLGNNIQAELAKQLGLTNRGVKDSAFYVLRNNTMPAVLSEIGFISNQDEEKLLNSADFRQKAALGLYRGILVFRGI